MGQVRRNKDRGFYFLLNRSELTMTVFFKYEVLSFCFSWL